LAVLTGVWPLLEIERGKLRLTGPSAKLLKPENRRPLREYLELQGRYAHLTSEDYEVLQRLVDERWRRIENWIKTQES